MAHVSTWASVLAVPMFAFVIGGCSTSMSTPAVHPSTALQGKLVVTGSSSAYPLVVAIAKRFEALHPGVQFEIRTGGSGKGAQDVRAGVADIGMMSRSLADDERDLFGFPIARDGVCFVVNQDNPVKDLSDQQIADIFTGKITNWREVGGTDAPITVVTRTVGHAELELVLLYFHLAPQQIKARDAQGDNLLALQVPVVDPNAIVFASLALAIKRVEQGSPIKLLPVARIAPTKQELRSGTFPLARSICLVTAEFPAGLKKAFIDYCLSQRATDLIEEQGFVTFLD